MLSVIRQKPGIDPFWSILNFYFPPPAIVLDVSYGKGQSWTGMGKKIFDGSMLTELDRKIFTEDEIRHHYPEYTIIKSDGFRDKGLDINSNWSNLPLRRNSVNVIYFDQPFLFSSSGYMTLRDGKGIYQERHVSRHGKGVEFPSREFADICTSGCILKIEDTYNGSMLVPQHVQLINMAYPWFYLKDIIIVEFGKGYGAGMMEHALIIHNYYLIFNRSARSVPTPEDEREEQVNRIYMMLKEYDKLLKTTEPPRRLV